MTTPGAAPNVQFGAYGPVADEEPSAAPNGGYSLVTGRTVIT
jgi:hypothetical protein